MVLRRRCELKMQTERLFLRRLCALDDGLVLRGEIALAVREHRRRRRREHCEAGNGRKDDAGKMASGAHGGSFGRASIATSYRACRQLFFGELSAAGAAARCRASRKPT